jgi:formylglycine-generating enzyme required for sulfatase activity
MAQGGNVWEWQESAAHGGNNDPGDYRVQRGGDWDDWSLDLRSLEQIDIFGPELEVDDLGFRVAAVPEPMESAGVIGIAALGFALWRRRASL